MDAPGDRPCQPVSARATDRDRTWTLGPDGERTEVAGSAADLLAWVAGRADGSDLDAPHGLPALPPWI
ncbi:hypothetical protein [Sporichthya sp.]|uniref:hypothetical protein n=1 Tax=Sporichthya sp. TaxID=65475 RepID=UPI0017E43191|nr:hypothetical protein [Sporichthya sp.]MBA3745343.1 hypothetical protein [Sporichthya sp.]